VVGGQLEYPVIVEVGVGVAIDLLGKTGPDPDEHEHEHGHEHGHGDVDIVEIARAGEAVELAHVPGKITIFDFWAPWCAPCKVLDRELVAIARRHPGRIAIRKINVVDWDSAAARRYLIPARHSLPYLVVEDADGRVLLDRHAGARALGRAVEAIVSGER
jgi:thiol-disulfide isomerase/thioredoxin